MKTTKVATAASAGFSGNRDALPDHVWTGLRVFTPDQAAKLYGHLREDLASAAYAAAVVLEIDEHCRQTKSRIPAKGKKWHPFDDEIREIFDAVNRYHENRADLDDIRDRRVASDYWGEVSRAASLMDSRDRSRSRGRSAQVPRTELIQTLSGYYLDDFPRKSLGGRFQRCVEMVLKFAEIEMPRDDDHVHGMIVDALAGMEPRLSLSAQLLLSECMGDPPLSE